MTDDRVSLAARFSAIEWLWLSGVEHEVGEQAGAGWARPPAAPAALSSPSPATAPTTMPAPAAGDFTTLDDLNGFLRNWKETGLAKTAFSTVLGSGALRPRLLVVTDMPDDHEDRSGNAFSSPFNRLVRQALSAAGFEQAGLYYTYLSKWRAPSRRALTATEAAFCRDMLEREIALVAPQAILAMGESVTRVLIPDSPPGIMRFPLKNTYINHFLSTETPLLASHKGEFLVKNPPMKKSFWFSLIEFAEAMCPGDFARGATSANNAEYISDV